MDLRSHASRRRYPLQVLLSVLFFALVLAVGLGVAWRGHVESRDVALAAAEENFAYVGQQIQSALRSAQEPAAIMAAMKREHHIDPELFELFLRSGVHLHYAERFLRTEQIDSVNVAALLGQPPDAPAGAWKS